MKLIFTLYNAKPYFWNLENWYTQICSPDGIRKISNHNNSYVYSIMNKLIFFIFGLVLIFSIYFQILCYILFKLVVSIINCKSLCLIVSMRNCQSLCLHVSMMNCQSLCFSVTIMNCKSLYLCLWSMMNCQSLCLSVSIMEVPLLKWVKNWYCDHICPKWTELDSCSWSYCTLWILLSIYL